MFFMGPEARADLARSGSNLFRWLPVLYGVVALSNAGRYWRWRLLLSRGQLLHEQLGYTRLPLVHVFMAERCADVAAIALLLLVLTPAQVLGQLPSAVAPLLLGLALLSLPMGCRPAGSTSNTTCPLAPWPERRRP